MSGIRPSTMQSQTYFDQKPRSCIMSRSYFDQRSSRTLVPHAAYRSTRRYRPSRFFPSSSSSSTSLLSSSSQLHQPPLSRSLNPTATDFEPAPLKPAHEQALASTYEPFWHQYPDWTRDSASMDTKPLSAGFGPMPRNETLPATKMPVPRRKVQELVDIYNADEFIQTIPLRLLVRFSFAAAEAFPRPVGSVTGLTIDRASVSRPPSPPDSGYYGSPSQVNDCKSTALPIDADISLPPPIVYKASNGRKEFRLFLDAPEMPSNEAVETAIEWMKDNAGVHGDEPLLEYGPTSLGSVQLVDLIDCYQAALSFQLRPSPKRIRIEILERLTRSRPDVNIFHQLSRFLPLDDPAIRRMINSYHDFWRAGQYSPEELTGFSVFLHAEENKDLANRVGHILKVRRVAYARVIEAAQRPEVVDGHRLPNMNRHQDLPAPNMSFTQFMHFMKSRTQAMSGGQTSYGAPENDIKFEDNMSTGRAEGDRKLKGETGQKILAQTKQAITEEIAGGTGGDASKSEYEDSTDQAGLSPSVNGRRRKRRAQQARGKALAAVEAEA